MSETAARPGSLVLVSACLLGHNTRYDGGNSLCPWLVRHLQQYEVLALCPELLLGVPREPVSFAGARPGREGEYLLDGRARLVSGRGHDYSQAFINGARRVLELAHNVKEAYLKDRSPSCAYDPDGLNPKGGPGLGVLSALLLRHGIKVHEVRV